MEPLGQHLIEREILALFGSGLLGVALLGLLMRATVPREQRPKLRAPLLMLVLYAVLSFAARAVPEDSRAHGYVEVLALLALLIAFGRMLTVFLLDWLLARRLHKELPRIVRDIVEVLFMTVAVLFTLRGIGVDPTSLLTTSAVLTAIIGLSLQDTLGNLFAGLSLQAQQPFTVGEWIQVDREERQVGQVVEVNWRATKLRTLDGAELVIPNGMLARTVIFNFSRPTPLVRRSVFLTIPYDFPTRTVHDVLLRAVSNLPGVADTPAPSVVTHGFREYGLEYWLRYFITEFDRREAIDGMVRDRLWYALGRAGIPVATPHHRIKMQQLDEGTQQKQDERSVQARARAIRNIDFLRDLPESAIAALAADARSELYEAGEIIVRQGDRGDDLYLCLSGELVVLHTPESGPRRVVARLSTGGLFGELSLLTGEPRSATVQAETPCELLVFGKPVFSRILAENPALAESISQRLAERQAALIAAGRVDSEEQHASVELNKGDLLRRVRQFFSL